MLYAENGSAAVTVLAATSSILGATGAAVTQQNQCDLNNDGAVNQNDVQLAVNMSLGLVPCTANIAGLDVCSAVVVQRVENAVNGSCMIGNPHTVALSWKASTSSNVVGYNVYRGTTSGGPYSKLNSSLASGTTYTDSSVVSDNTYYYVCTAIDSSNDESAYSSQAQAVIPYP